MLKLTEPSMLNITSITLEGKHVFLRPPTINDLDRLSSAPQDGEVWNNPYALFPRIKEISTYLQDLVKDQKTILHL